MWSAINLDQNRVALAGVKIPRSMKRIMKLLAVVGLKRPKVGG
jgi:hypothetical protein